MPSQADSRRRPSNPRTEPPDSSASAIRTALHARSSRLWETSPTMRSPACRNNNSYGTFPRKRIRTDDPCRETIHQNARPAGAADAQPERLRSRRRRSPGSSRKSDCVEQAASTLPPREVNQTSPSPAPVNTTLHRRPSASQPPDRQAHSGSHRRRRQSTAHRASAGTTSVDASQAASY